MSELSGAGERACLALFAGATPRWDDCGDAGVILMHGLERFALDRNPPERLARTFERACELTVRHNVRLLHLAGRISAATGALPFKGVSLLPLYPDISYRPMVDLDVLTDEPARTVATLVGEGFDPLFPHRALRLRFRLGYAMALSHGSSLVEVHWRPATPPWHGRMSARALLTAAVGGRLREEHAALVSAVHVARSIRLGKLRLLSLTDFALLTARADVALLEEAAERFELSPVLAVARRALESAREGVMPSASVDVFSVPRGAWGKARARAQALLHGMAPVEELAIPLPPPLSPLYIVLRALNLLWKRARGEREKR